MKRFERGAAAVELAILIIPLMILGAGMTEIGRALYDYNEIVTATRDAARFLSMQPPGAGEEAARCLAVHGNPTCSGEPILPGLETSMVKIEYESAVPTGHGSIDLVNVRVEGFAFASMIPSIVADLTFAPIGTTMRQAST